MDISTNTYDISILDSLFDTNGKQENFKNYKNKLLHRTLVNIYLGFHSIDELVQFLTINELTVNSPSELIYWIQVYYKNWVNGINKRIAMCDDYLLIKPIITKHFTDLKQEGRINLVSTIEYINSINFDDLLTVAPTFENDEETT